MRFLGLAAVAIAGAAALAAQSSSNVVGLGYSAPPLLPVAPGQIVTIFVTGVNPSPSTGASASSVPLPTSLAGITVNLTQANPSLPTPDLRVPIFAVSSTVALCPGDPSDNCNLIGVTVRIPVELAAPLPNDYGLVGGPAVLTVSDGTNTTPPILLNPVWDQIHIFAITHVDGSRVTPSSPATAGEVLVMYASGLGLPLSVALAGNTGAASPSPATPVVSLYAMNYDYRINASPSRAGATVPLPSPDPTILFVGLTPTLVGVWQINFVLPKPPGPILACDNAGVLSNVTVTLAGQVTFDGAGICVTPPSQ